MSFLDENLSMLEKIQPSLAQELRRLAPARHIDLMPLEQDIPEVDALIVVGLPSAESWPRILGTRTPFVILAHGALPDLRAYLTLMDVREPLGRGRISFAVGEDGVLQVLNDLFGTLYRRSITMFGQPGTPGHDEALREMRFFETLCAANRATLDQFAEEWQTNLSENASLPPLPAAYPITALFSSIPLTVWCLAGFGIVRARREPAIRAAAVLFAAPVLFFMAYRTVSPDGIRHLFLSLPFLAALSAEGFMRLNPALKVLVFVIWPAEMLGRTFPQV